MKTSARSTRLVSALAVAAVSIAAVATVASSWPARAPAVSPAATLSAQRPAADAPVQVVKAPATGEPRRQSVGCPDCLVQPSQERRL